MRLLGNVTCYTLGELIESASGLTGDQLDFTDLPQGRRMLADALMRAKLVRTVEDGFAWCLKDTGGAPKAAAVKRVVDGFARDHPECDVTDHARHIETILRSRLGLRLRSLDGFLYSMLQQGRLVRRHMDDARWALQWRGGRPTADEVLEAWDKLMKRGVTQ
jgi:hypothetical protein